MKSSIFIITVIILAGALFSPVETNGQNRSGEYLRDSTGIIAIQDTGRGKNRRLILSIVVGQSEPSCSGSLIGKAAFIGKNVAELVFNDCEDKTDVKTVDRENEICRIKIVFSGTRLVVKEGDKCHRCHGFSCIFEGTYLKKMRATSPKQTAKGNQ